ncbi:MAG: glutathione peroxidase [Saprospiraceae bacterium]|nr:glutathione peroxidase [Saprospiraceae bacterium]
MTLLPLVSWLISSGFILQSDQTASGTPEVLGTFYDLTVEDIDGGIMEMDNFKGKYILCVNVASKCGFTPQYKDLQALYEQHADRLVVIGFPCNQFLVQEPGAPSEIKAFCEKNYGVTFPLTSKIMVKGKEQHPVYQWLTSQDLAGSSDHEVKWNFHKFLVSPEGKLIGSFPSKVNPLSTEILTSLESY